MEINLATITFNPETGGGGGSGEEVKLQSKTLSVTENGTTTVIPDAGYDGMTSVRVNADIPIPTFDTQIKEVTITENGTVNVTPDDGYDGLSNVTIMADFPKLDFNTQAKTLAIINNGITNVIPDDGYDGLSSVKINVQVSGSNKIVIPNGIKLAGSSFTTFDADRYDWSCIRDFKSMFYNCWLLSTITGIENMNVSNAVNMTMMFVDCDKITDFNIKSWDVSNVRSMSTMFLRCNGVTTLDLSGWDTSNVTNMYATFSQMKKLTTLDLSGWDTSNVTDMENMFSDSCNLSIITGIENINVGNVVTMDSMFNGCTGLTSLDLSGWDTSKVTDMEGMFSGCTELVTVDLRGWDFSKQPNVKYMFDRCVKLQDIWIDGDLSYVSNFNNFLPNLTNTGRFHYNPQYDISVIENNSKGWTFIPIE